MMARSRRVISRPSESALMDNRPHTHYDIVHNQWVPGAPGLVVCLASMT
jgi:hypothetical protein